jgi:hypothetical protein
MAFGDYLQLQRENIGFAVNGQITATEQTATAAVTVKSAAHQIFVQRICLSITTHVNAKVALTVQSSNGTPVVIASRTDLTAAAGVPDFIMWDFGPIGIPVALGESLNWLWSTGGSGPTGRVHIEGYQKLASTVAVASTN